MPLIRVALADDPPAVLFEDSQSYKDIEGVVDPSLDVLLLLILSGKISTSL
jgi:hypothetical protein